MLSLLPVKKLSRQITCKWFDGVMEQGSQNAARGAGQAGWA